MVITRHNGEREWETKRERERESTLSVAKEPGSHGLQDVDRMS